MVSVIEVSAKIEALIVWISAFMLAAGSAGSLLVQNLPEAYKILGTSICGGLVLGSILILAVWHKFVNTLQVNLPSGTQTTTTQTTVTAAPAPAPAQTAAAAEVAARYPTAHAPIENPTPTS